LNAQLIERGWIEYDYNYPCDNVRVMPSLNTWRLIRVISVVVVGALVALIVVLYGTAKEVDNGSNWMGITSDDRFSVRDGVVFSHGRAIEGADPVTFEVWKSTKPNSPWVWYARDSRHVYRGMQLFETQQRVYAIVPGADPRTFKPLEGADGFSGFSEDAHHVYHAHDRGWEIDNNPVVLELVAEADPLSFGIILWSDGSFTGYAHDMMHVYSYYGNYFETTKNPKSFLVGDAEPLSFEVLSGFSEPGCIDVGLVGKDVHHVFAGSEIVAHADAKSFSLDRGTETKRCFTLTATDSYHTYFKNDYFGTYIMEK